LASGDPPSAPGCSRTLEHLVRLGYQKRIQCSKVIHRTDRDGSGVALVSVSTRSREFHRRPR
jgi:hypothetical protein